MESKIFVNGELLSATGLHLSALDRGFTLADGAFETMRAIGGKVFRLENHLARLRSSCDVLGFEISGGNEAIQESIKETLAANELADATVRLAFSRGVPETRGLLPPKSPSPTMVIQVVPFSSYPAEKYRSGFAAIISSVRRNESSPASRIKSSNYLDNIFARMEASARACDEAIMLDSAGHVSCGSSSNIFVIADGRVTTPPPECGVLCGITRGVVREVLPRIDLEWDERPVSIEDLFAADEAFFTNSVMGIGPLTDVDGRPIGSGKPGPATSQISGAYLALIREFHETARLNCV